MTGARRVVLVVLLVLAVAPYFIGLGDSAIWDANEAFYVETPRQMIERGNWIDPSFNGQPRFNKPPLSYWIVAGFYQAFGESVVTERLAIALGALLLVAAAFGAGRAVFSTEAGLLAALAVASAPRVVMFSRRIFIDVYITMFMGLTLVAYVLAERQPARRRRYLALMYVAAGLGFLTKGPIAIVLPALAILAYLAVERRLGDLHHLMLPTGALIVAAIVVPWYATIYAEHGWIYIRKFFLEENLSRYTAPYGDKVDARGWWFYGPVLLTDLFPWSIVGIAALGLFAWRAWCDRQGGLPVLLVAWVAVIVGFFSLSQSKQDLYIFPAVTAFAALAGGALALGLDGHDRAQSTVRWALASVGVLLLVAGLGVLYLFASAARVYALEGATLVGWIAMVAGVAVAGLALRRWLFGAVVALAAAVILVNGVFVTRALPSFRKYQPVPAMAERIRVMASSNARVGYYGIGLPSLVYYLHRPVFEALDPDQAAELFGSGEAWCLVRDADYATLQGALRSKTCVKAREPIFDVKIGSVLARRPLSELLLISNACP